MAASLRSDSPICRRVVRAFVDFLNSVQPAPGVDLESLDVVRDCLEEVFKLNSFPSDDAIQPDMLVDLFSSFESVERNKGKSDLGSSLRDNTSCTTSSSQQVEDSIDFKTSNGKDQVHAPDVLGGDSKDELLGKFLAALDKINFFKASPDGVEDPAQVTKATKLFDDALMDMENSAEGHIINISNLAEMFKLKGNQSMQSNSYSEAVELYTCAIALCQSNAVYYCNRAAAFTRMHRYAEAIQDCFKSIEINPIYSKAYSRLGLAYYAQGNYEDALNKGFLKALQLDPNNDSVKENIRVAQHKLMEQYQHAEASQNIGSNHGHRSSAEWEGSPNEGFSFGSFSFDVSAPQGNIFQSARSAGHNPTSFFSFMPPSHQTPPPPSAGTQATGPTDGSAPSTSFPFNVSIPTGFAEALRTVASAAQVQQPDTSDGAAGSEARMGENTGFRFGEVPEQASDVLRAVMGMFSSQHGSQNEHRDGGGNGA